MVAERTGIERITLTAGEKVVSLTDEQFVRGTRALASARPAPIPADIAFEARGVDFLEAPEIEAIATSLIGKYDEFAHLVDTSIAYCWKRKGGEATGKSVFGKCVKSSGLVRYFSKQSFVIWLAADNCREWGFTHRQLEALIYHELCHAGEDEGKDGEPKAVLVPHDVEAFGMEIERYGLWTQDLQQIKPYFDGAQLVLPGMAS